MKKKLTMLLLFVLGTALCLSASAQTLGIALGDKVYTFAGGEGTYIVDGKTFVIDANAVTIREEGKPDRVLEIEYAQTALTTEEEVMMSGIEEYAYSSEDATELAEDEDAAKMQQTTANATTENQMSSDEIAAFFADYAPFGLEYDAQTNVLSYQGLRIRRFTDILQSNGEAMESGSFSGSLRSFDFDTGEIDVETVRDYAKPDAQGYGALIGVTIQKVR